MTHNYFSKKLFITLITLFLQTTFLSANSIRFISVDYPTVTRLSSEQNKFFFVNFSAKWCPTCTVMEETANANAELVEYIHNNFIAVKADVDDIIGKEWQNKYEVTCLPTLIVFSSDGQEITRIGGGLTASEFLIILKSIEDENPSYVSRNLNENNQDESVRENDFSNQNGLTAKGAISNNNENGIENTPSNNSTRESTFASSSSSNYNPNKSQKSAEFEIVIETNATSNTGMNTSPNTLASQESSSENFSHLSQNTTNKASENNLDAHLGGVLNPTTSVQNNTDNFSSKAKNNNTSTSNNVSSDGDNATTNEHHSNSTTNVAVRNNCSRFGVQVGMYANEDNANRKRKRMKRSLSQPIFIQQQIVKGQLLYQVIVGEYLDLQEAIRFQKRLTSKGVKGYLVQR